MSIRLWWNERQTLRFVNELLANNRHTKIQFLPLGKINSATENPIVLALQCIATCTIITKPYRVEFGEMVVSWRPHSKSSIIHASARRIPLPNAVSRFLIDFDNYRYPALLNGGLVLPPRMQH